MDQAPAGHLVDHSGEPTWSQRARTGVLAAAPAALAGTAALRAATGPGPRYDERMPIEIAVDLGRHIPRHPGCRFARVARERVQWTASPPRVRLEHAALDVAQRTTSDLALVASLADVCQSRCTTAARLLQALRARPRVSRRQFMVGVLTDIAGGTCSVLEHGYLTRMERPHGLPAGRRQVSERRGAGRPTVRLGCGQVFDRPCETTVRVAIFLRAGGWTGVPTASGPTCPV